jgi:hypothetical protein
MDLVKRLLLLATLLAVALPGTAGAAGTPCRNKIVTDWTRDGKIASTYPLACYRDALKHIPPDADIYSSLRNDVSAAMRAATRRTQGLSAPSVVGRGFKEQPTSTSSVKGTVTAFSAPKPHDPRSTGFVATAGDAPLPILVLGGIALALVAAGAIGVGVRHARGHRPR